MVRDPRREIWEAKSNLAVGTVNRDADMHHILKGCKGEFEYILEGVSVDFSLASVSFRGLGEFGWNW